MKTLRDSRVNCFIEPQSKSSYLLHMLNFHLNAGNAIYAKYIQTARFR